MRYTAPSLDPRDTEHSVEMSSSKRTGFFTFSEGYAEEAISAKHSLSCLSNVTHCFKGTLGFLAFRSRQIQKLSKFCVRAALNGNKKWVSRSEWRLYTPHRGRVRTC